MRPSSFRRKYWCGVVFFSLLMIYQLICWYLYAAQEIAPAPAVAFDQVNYLLEVYHSYFIGQTQGVAVALGDFFKNAPGQGFLLQLTALLGLQWLPFGRASALLINILIYVVVTSILFMAFRPRYRFGFAALLLAYIISLKTLGRLSGGLMDFRLDFAGLGVLALVCLAIWRSYFFTKPRYCVLAGLLLIMLCATRFIMVVEMVSGIAGLYLIAFNHIFY